MVAGVLTRGRFRSFLAPISTPSTSSLRSPLSCKVLVTLLLFLPFHFISQAGYILNVVISALIRVYNSQGKPDGYFLNFLIPILLIEGFPSEEPFTLVFAHCFSSSGHTRSFKVAAGRATAWCVEVSGAGGPTHQHREERGGEGPAWEEESHPQAGPGGAGLG